MADGGSPCPLDNFAGRNSTYYDSDNLRCTFFVNKTKCRSRLNVDIICSAIRRAGLDVSVSKDDDIVLNNGNEVQNGSNLEGRGKRSLLSHDLRP